MEEGLEQFFQLSSEDIYERKTFKVDPGQDPMRLDKWVQIHLEGVSRNKIQQAIEAAFLTVNGKAQKNNYKVRPGDEISYLSITNTDYSEITPEKMSLDIVYEDKDVMVINKPSNLVVHPGVGNRSGTLLNGVAFHLLEQDPNLSEEELPRFGLVHRIDKNTTGLMVIAKTAGAAAHLAKQFFNHTVERRYTAVVWGDVAKEEGTIYAHVGRHKRFRKIFDAYPDGEIGKRAITHFKVLERFHYVTVIQCKLETGRTHQIRVHMKFLGHTLFNDWEYGGDQILKGTVHSKYKQFVENCFNICSRCALHATTLGFIHPTTQQYMHFEAPLPLDMQLLINKWREYYKNKIGSPGENEE